MRERLRRLAACGAVLAAGLWSTAQALTLAPPEPLALRFEPNGAQLNAAGTAQVDRLAVRAAQCGDGGPLHLTLSQDARVAPLLQQARQAAVSGQLASLGVALSASTRQRRAAPGVAARSTGQVKLTVRGGDDVHCFFDDSRLLRGWVAQLAAQVARPAGAEPVFWSRMSGSVRDEELALPLARLALCVGIERCSVQREVFWWLASRAPQGQSADARESWLELVWVAGSDADLARAGALLRLPALPLARRGLQADELARGPLPWPVVERRLLAPGVLTAAALSEDVYAHVAVQDLIQSVVKRGEVAAIGRLLDAASPSARACYVTQAVMVASQEEFHARVMPYLAGWLAKPATPLEGSHHCHSTDALLLIGVCVPALPAERSQAPWRKGAEVWRSLIDAGFTLDEARIDFLARAGDSLPCRYQRTGDPAMPLRAAPES